MQKIHRHKTPDWLEENKEAWSKDFINTKDFPYLKYKGESVFNMLSAELAKMTNNHCSFCDEKIVPIYARIAFFKPQPIVEWSNLYISCPFCIKKTIITVDDNVLYPDAPDYEFDRYFSINFKTGEIEPNSKAKKEDIQKAKITIDSFGLNSNDRPSERLKELQKAQKQPSKSFNLNDFSYRFFVERGLRILKDIKFADIKINSISIKNIRCFNDITIDFTQNCNLLVGTNSRGKTTILQLITIGLLHIEYIPFINSWFNVVRKNNEEGFFTINISYKNEIIKLEYLINQDDRIILLSEKKMIDNLKNILVLGYGSNRYIKYQEEKPNNTKLQPIATLFGENDYLKHIRRLNTYLQIETHFDTLKELINAVFEQADKSNKIRLEKYDSEYKSEKLITLYFSTPTNSQEFIPLEALSDGFKATFVWLFDMTIRIVENLGNIYNRKEISGIVLIDEIDLHIHPRWQRTILPTLCTLFPKIQFIVTTHSDLVAQSVQANFIKKLYLNEKDSSVDVANVKFGKGSSSSFIYDNVFDIKETYDVETESELKQFTKLRNQVLENKISVNDKKVKQIVNKLVSKSKQLEIVISQELNQIQRLTGDVFVL